MARLGNLPTATLALLHHPVPPFAPCYCLGGGQPILRAQICSRGLHSEASVLALLALLSMYRPRDGWQLAFQSAYLLGQWMNGWISAALHTA